MIGDIIRTVFLIAGAIPAIGFPIWYHLRMRWSASEMGRHVMGYSFVVALAYASALFKAAFGNYPGESAVRAAIMVLMTVVVWWRVIVFFRLYRQNHPRQARKTTKPPEERSSL